MTAEIAVLNKMAVTLAADSAVTLFSGGQQKVYHSADKIFEVSPHDPIGLMVYNNLELHGIPVETIAKNFRDRHCQQHYPTVFEFAEAFLDHVEKLTCPEVTVAENIFFSVLPELMRAREVYSSAFTRAVAKLGDEAGGEKARDLIRSIGAEVTDALRARLSRLEAQPDPDWGKGVTVAEIHSAHQTTLEQAIDHAFKDTSLVDGAREILLRLAAAYLVKDFEPERLTGMVFAGYGENEIFPSLTCYEIYGNVAGRLKYRQMMRFDVDRSLTPEAEIFPFAQQEMVDRFILGIDANFLNLTTAFFDGALDKLRGELSNTLTEAGGAGAAEVEGKLPAAIHAILEEFRGTVVPEQLARAKAQMSDMVRFMPKQELAALAESLVNITSLKRRFSSEAESVGGPIDVAVITRAEGFVWVKRKHFFDPSLNPRYFFRRYGQWSHNEGRS